MKYEYLIMFSFHYDWANAFNVTTKQYIRSKTSPILLHISTSTYMSRFTKANKARICCNARVLNTSKTTHTKTLKALKYVTQKEQNRRLRVRRPVRRHESNRRTLNYRFVILTSRSRFIETRYIYWLNIFTRYRF